MKLRSLVFILVLAFGGLGLVRDVVTHGGVSAKDTLVLALGALGLAQNVTSNGGVGQKDAGKPLEVTAKDPTPVTEIVAKGAARADHKAA
jgi:hypothetical protein